MTPRLQLSLRDPRLQRYARLTLPIMMGFSIVLADEWIWKKLASHLQEGSVAWLSYGRILMRVPLGIVGLAMGAAAYPTMAGLVASGNLERMYGLLKQALKMSLFIAAVAVCCMIVLRVEIAYIVYSAGGRAMTAADVEAIGAALLAFSLGLFAWIAQLLIGRAYYACSDTVTTTVVGSLTAIAALPVYMVLRDLTGFVGLAITSSLAVTTYAVILWLRLPSAVAYRRGTGGPAEWSEIISRVLPVGFLLGVITAAGLQRTAVIVATSLAALACLVFDAWRYSDRAAHTDELAASLAGLPSYLSRLALGVVVAGGAGFALHTYLGADGAQSSPLLAILRLTVISSLIGVLYFLVSYVTIRPEMLAVWRLIKRKLPGDVFSASEAPP